MSLHINLRIQIITTTREEDDDGRDGSSYLSSDWRLCEEEHS